MPRQGERIGVFGGTFDPPHIGHLTLGVNVAHALGLQRVLYVVASVPWQKVGSREISAAADRLAMTSLAVADAPGCVVSSIEVARGGPSYTAQTLTELHQQHPEDELFLIIGSDLATQLPTWERVDEIQALADRVVVGRPGTEADEPPKGWSWRRIDAPLVDLSSSDIRDRTRRGVPIDYLVPHGVRDYIARHRLYVSSDRCRAPEST